MQVPSPNWSTKPSRFHFVLGTIFGAVTIAPVIDWITRPSASNIIGILVSSLFMLFTGGISVICMMAGVRAIKMRKKHRNHIHHHKS